MVAKGITPNLTIDGRAVTSEQASYFIDQNLALDWVLKATTIGSC